MSIEEEILKLLEIEKKIDYKKSKNIPLSDFEKFYDLYFFRTELLLTMIGKRL